MVPVDDRRYLLWLQVYGYTGRFLSCVDLETGEILCCLSPRAPRWESLLSSGSRGRHCDDRFQANPPGWNVDGSLVEAAGFEPASEKRVRRLLRVYFRFEVYVAARVMYRNDRRVWPAPLWIPVRHGAIQTVRTAFASPRTVAAIQATEGTGRL